MWRSRRQQRAVSVGARRLWRQLSTERVVPTNGYKSIGSFHSDNVEDLMLAPETDYRPPPLPFEPQPHGNELPVQQTDFLLDQSDWTFVNHGAFGAALKCGHDRANQWREYLERQPLRYFDRDLLPNLVHSGRLLSKFCKADRAGLALTQNATTALNAVIQGHVRTCRERGVVPTIVLWDMSYGSVKKMANQYGAHVVEIPFQSKYLHNLHVLSPTEEAFLKALEQTIESTNTSWGNALLILDQTTSNTALNLPIPALAKRAKQEGMLVLVDGAHGLLAQDIELDSDDYENVDFYVSNGHKWLCCPRGVAMLYCAKAELRETTLRQPAVVSHGIDDGYLSRFLWDGTRDYAAQLSLPVVLDYWNRMNPASVRMTMRAMLMDAIQILADIWHDGCEQSSWVGRVTIAPMNVLSPMALVRLPEPLCGNSTGNAKTSSDAKRIQDFLFQNRVEAPIKCINGVLYVRLSCHVYNEPCDYERLGNVMSSLP